MSPRRRQPKPGIGLPFIGGAAGALGFAVLFFFTGSIPVGLIGGVLIGLGAVVYFPLRRRRRARADRR